MALGLGRVFVGVQTAANAGVPADEAGLVAALITASSTLGGAPGLATFSALATSRTNHQLAARASPAAALTSGFSLASTACRIFVVASAFIASRVRSNHIVTTAFEAHPALAVEAA
jgi:hypothetical protein